jgi:4-hydroxy-4-methyl-2-oxoglutarate aldolase
VGVGEDLETDILVKLGAFSVSQVSDALGFSHPVEVLVPPLDPMFRVCGRAVTVQCEPDDNLGVLHALDHAQKGDILVIACSGGSGAAVWGELLSVAAQYRGLAGTIVDGSVRDAGEIKAMGYPVFSRYTNGRRALKEKPGVHNIPVRCGSIVIQPGEIVFADANGILAISPTVLREVLLMVAAIARKESEIKQQLLTGIGIVDILKLQRLPATQTSKSTT